MAVSIIAEQDAGETFSFAINVSAVIRNTRKCLFAIDDADWPLPDEEQPTAMSRIMPFKIIADNRQTGDGKYWSKQILGQKWHRAVISAEVRVENEETAKRQLGESKTPESSSTTMLVLAY